ncbi:hypothetical protein RDWZM_003821 [Blomia tropicalis]|uniref:Uncharacterized protein n=1 Tax=Blomia tropicalis TaxID=40697 RepID=A0A9Q0RSY4_BLOTA|nr:hypothetical protein RDWZM_003821 [Blomia tropicalis]
MHFQSFIIFAVIIILFTLAIEVELKHQYKPVHKSPLSLSKKELEYLRQKTDLRKTKESMSVATHMPHSKPERPTSKELMEDNVNEIFKGEPKPESPSKPNDEPELSEIPKQKLIPESLKPIDEPDSSEIPKQKPIPDFSKIPNPKETNEFSSITNDEPQSEPPVISNDQTDLNSIVESTFPNLDDKSNGETQPIDIITELSSTTIVPNQAQTTEETDDETTLATEPDETTLTEQVDPDILAFDMSKEDVLQHSIWLNKNDCTAIYGDSYPNNRASADKLSIHAYFHCVCVNHPL